MPFAVWFFLIKPSLNIQNFELFHSATHLETCKIAFQWKKFGMFAVVYQVSYVYVQKIAWVSEKNGDLKSKCVENRKKSSGDKYLFVNIMRKLSRDKFWSWKLICIYITQIYLNEIYCYNNL
jgi:hypothetical protein